MMLVSVTSISGCEQSTSKTDKLTSLGPVRGIAAGVWTPSHGNMTGVIGQGTVLVSVVIGMGYSRD
jgi:hypothetical protein